MTTACEPLPLRSAPLPGEALPSWLGRIAARYELSLGEFLWSVLGEGQTPRGWTQPTRSTLETIAARTAVPTSTVALTTFAGWAGLAQLAVTEATIPRRSWIGRVGNELAVCPHCLGGNETRYARKLWTIGFAAVCPVHRSLLVSACPSCGARPSLSANGELRTCRRCSAPHSSGTPAHPLAARWQARLLIALRTGWIATPRAGPIYWRLFVDAVGLLGEVWAQADARQRQRLAAAVAEYTGGSVAPLRLGAPKDEQLMERHDALLTLAWLLEGWPGSMIETADILGVSTQRSVASRRATTVKAVLQRLPWPLARDLCWRMDGWDRPDIKAIEDQHHLMRVRSYLSRCGVLPPHVEDVYLWDPDIARRWAKTPLVRNRDAWPAPTWHPGPRVTPDFERGSLDIRPSCFEAGRLPNPAAEQVSDSAARQ